MDIACPACAAPNPESGRFCEECGAPLAAVCPSCGTPVTRIKKFCGTCGFALGGAGAQAATDVAPDQSPLATERRVCSVLFCDLVGFTPLSESRDAEEVRALLSRYFETARTVIRRYGGVVEKFIGDAVMAVWGTPVAVEGDTERAVRAGLELVGAVAALGAEINAPALAARAGVVTGEVAVAVGATNEGMVAGDAVNTAARVQAAASAGTVLVDETTRRLAQPALEFDDAGEHELKGKSQPQRLWRALRVVSGVGGAQRVDGLEAPLIGRDAELRILKDMFHASADRGQPRLMVVVGPAGVGKSRLGWEFEKYVDGLSAAVWWHRGRCLSYGEGVSFWALAEIVRQRLGIAEEDPVETAADKLVQGLEQHLTDAAERDYVGVRLARLLGVPFASDAAQNLAREELFAGWRLWFERLSQTSPVVMLIEDLHTADAGLLDFLDHLMDWAREVPIFVLAFARPELEERHPGWVSGRNRTSLALHPLDPQFMSVLLDALIPEIPSDASAAIANHAHGIPLFAVETVRALIDRDIVVPRDGVYRLVADVGELSVPDSLHGLLAARLDALPAESHGLVADASVLGSTFPAEALIAVSGGDAAAVGAALTDLVRREVLEILADPLSPQRGTYRFSHDMLRQVAYDTLSRHDRRTRHLAVAVHLRTVFAGDGEEVVDVIARHYLDAVAAVPDAPDTDDIRQRAIEMLIRAGDRAERTGDKSRAAGTYAHAAELLGATGAENAGRAARVWEQASEAALNDADFSAAVRYADRAREGYLLAGDERAAARSQIGAGTALRRRGQHAQARERLDAALEVLTDRPDTDTVRALDQRASVEIFAGSDGARMSDEALRLGQALGVAPQIMAGLFVGRAISLSMTSRRIEAACYLREAARLADQSGDRNLQGIALLNLSDALGMHDPAASADAARDAAAVLRHTGNRWQLAFAIQNLAVALFATDDWNAIDDELGKAITDDGLGDIEVIAGARAWLAAMRGHAELATSSLAQMVDGAASEDPQDRAALLMLQAFTAYAQDRPQDALALARRCLQDLTVLGLGSDIMRWCWPLAARSAVEAGDVAAVAELLELIERYQPGEVPPMVQSERALTLARIAAQSGAPAQDELFESAVALMRTLGTPYHLAQGLLDYAQHLAATGRAGEAAALVEEAQGIGDRLGATSLLARAADAGARLGADVRTA